MSLLSRWASYFRGAPPAKNVTIPDNGLGGIFDDLLRSQVSKPRHRTLTDPLTGEVFNKEKMSFETKLRDP